MELKKGPWSREEDQKLMSYIEQHGHGSWRSLPPKAGLERCGKSCRLRWTNYLRPDIKRGKFSPHEEKAVIRLHALLGNKWSAIAVHLPKRTANEIKNYWNTRLKKRLTRMGIDPATHKPKSNGSAQHADLSHMAQWETARLEAESRFSKLHLIGRFITPPPRPTFPCLDVLNAASWQANAGTLDFSFSNSTATVPKVSSLMENEAVVPAYNYVVATDEGKMENSSQVHSNYGVSMGAMDLAAADHNSEGYNVTGGGGGGGVGDIAGEFEDIMNYWNDLLMVPPGL